MSETNLIKFLNLKTCIHLKTYIFQLSWGKLIEGDDMR